MFSWSGGCFTQCHRLPGKWDYNSLELEWEEVSPRVSEEHSCNRRFLEGRLGLRGGRWAATWFRFVASAKDTPHLPPTTSPLLPALPPSPPALCPCNTPQLPPCPGGALLYSGHHLTCTELELGGRMSRPVMPAGHVHGTVLVQPYWDSVHSCCIG